ncbi:MAG: polyprenol monophosphomannose synthase [archaeon]
MLSLILPTLNEAKNISILIPEINNSLRGIRHEIIVVDDNSSDNTPELAEKYPNVRVIRRTERGLSSAILAGFAAARGDILGVMDSDRSHPAGSIIKALGEMKDYDIVILSRKINGGRISDWSRIRRLISNAAIMLAKPITHYRDPVSGYFFMRRDTLQGLKIRPIGYKILLDILFQARQARVKEIPYTFSDRAAGRSKLTIKVISCYIWQVLRIYKKLIQRTAAGHT